MGFGRFGSGDEANDWSRSLRHIWDEMTRRKLCDFRCSAAWQPTVNVYASRTHLHVCVELAGVEPSSVSVECPAPARVAVVGERARPRLEGLSEPYSVELLEIDEGPFRREIELPHAVEAGAIELRHEKGYVWITLRKTDPT